MLFRSSFLDISEVVNTNLQSGDTASEAVIAGKGVGSSQGSEKFEARDWGVLMCIYHNVPLLDYVSSAPDPQLFVSQNTDLPIPELDSSGMQSIPVSMYSNGAKDRPLKWEDILVDTPNNEEKQYETDDTLFKKAEEIRLKEEEKRKPKTVIS